MSRIRPDYFENGYAIFLLLEYDQPKRYLCKEADWSNPGQRARVLKDAAHMKKPTSLANFPADAPYAFPKFYNQ